MRCVTVLVFMIYLLPAQIDLTAWAAGADLNAMAGTWSGRGHIRPDNFDDKQRVKCKIRVVVEGSAKTTLAGRCATASRSHKLTLEISRSRDGKEITSIGRVSGSKRPFLFRGRETSGGFVLKTENPIEQNGRTISSTVSIRLRRQDQLTILQRVTDMVSGETIDAVSITLTR